ncbi:putative tRNA intron endonuclease [Sarcoptes scabiei]|nr:putative tRNA intron endonuclease [Sarcoptes scabiei]
MSDKNLSPIQRIYRKILDNEKQSSQLMSSPINASRVLKMESPITTTITESSIFNPSKPYQSVKKLLIPKRSFEPNESNIDESSLIKRSKLSTITTLNEPLILRSRDCFSTPSSTPSLSDAKHLRSSIHLGNDYNGRDSPSILSRNSSSDQNSYIKSTKNTGSYFYPGKTVFGGANLRKDLRFFNSTPYSKMNVKRVEPTRTSSSVSFFEDDLPLSSTTKRILERLDRAALPIQDAKSKISSYADSDRSIGLRSKLFDTPRPVVENKGLIKIDTNHKPIRYILQAEDNIETSDSRRLELSRSIENDMEKLNQIKSVEKELQQKQSFPTNDFVSKNKISWGKITSKDVKKGRKIDDNISNVENQNHLDSLAKVQPLTASSTFKFNFDQSSKIPAKILASKTEIVKSSDKASLETSPCDKIPSEEFSFRFSSPKRIASFRPSISSTVESIKFSSPEVIWANQASKSKNETATSQISENLDRLDSNQSKINSNPKLNEISLFDQFKKKKSSESIWSCTTCFTENEIDAKNCIACEQANPNIKISESIAVEKQKSFKFGFASDKNITESTGSNFDALAETKPSLNQLFKKDSTKTWTCSTCSVSNDIDEAVCVSCEEPNPSKKPSLIGTKTFSSPLKSMTTSITPVSNVPLNEIFKKSSNQWTCSECMVNNEANQSRCVSCETPNSKNSNAIQSDSASQSNFGFKFGSFSNPVSSSISTKISNDPDKTITKSSNSLNENEWKCFYCNTVNKNNDKNICVECNKIKVIAATKNQLQKFTESQTFKFGSINNSEIQSQSSDLEAKSSSNLSILPTNTSLSSGRFVNSGIGEQKSDVVEATKTDKILDQTKPKFGFASPTIASTPTVAFTNKETLFDEKNVPKNSTESNSISVKDSSSRIDATKFNFTKPFNNNFQFGSNETKKNPSSDSTTLAASKPSMSFTQTFTSTTASEASVSSLNEKPSLFDFGRIAPVSSSQSATSSSSSFSTNGQSNLFNSVVTSNEFGGKNLMLKNILNKSDVSDNKNDDIKSNKEMEKNFGSGINSSIFTFGKSTDDTKPFVFGATGQTSEKSKPVSTSQPTGGNFPSQAPKQSDLPKFETNQSNSDFSFSSHLSNNSKNLFMFTGNPSSSTSSAFSSSSNPTAATTSVATSTSSSSSSMSLGKKLDFGSPLQIPPINLGPVAPKIVINANEPSTTQVNSTSGVNSSLSTSIFTFGSSRNTNTEQQTRSATDFKFDFGATPNSSINTNPVFGSSSSSSFPTNFNFTGNNNSSNTSSLFTFGSKPPSDQQQSLQSNSLQKSQTGFNFGAAVASQPNLISFGSLPSQSSNVPVIPSFTAGTQSNQLFKFGSENPTANNNTAVTNFPIFAAKSNESVFGNVDTANGMFPFSVNQNQMGGPSARKIKKAKRRLG